MFGFLHCANPDQSNVQLMLLSLGKMGEKQKTEKRSVHVFHVFLLQITFFCVKLIFLLLELHETWLAKFRRDNRKSICDI